MKWLKDFRNNEDELPVGIELNVAGERKEFVLGVELGQKRDHTAVAIVERSDVIYRERSAVTYRPFQKTELRLVFLERLELGLPYPQIVSAIVETVRRLQQPGSSWTVGPNIAVVVDATGVGNAVVDLLKAAGLGCELVPVTITGGEHESQTAWGWTVPKRDLVSELEVIYATEALLMADDLEFADALMEELDGMEVKPTESGNEKIGAWREGTHDDLVLAVALAVWRAKKGKKSPWGKARLI
jgi:hypothetical protein